MSSRRAMPLFAMPPRSRWYNDRDGRYPLGALGLKRTACKIQVNCTRNRARSRYTALISPPIALNSMVESAGARHDLQGLISCIVRAHFPSMLTIRPLFDTSVSAKRYEDSLRLKSILFVVFKYGKPATHRISSPGVGQGCCHARKIVRKLQYECQGT